ncbi:hypothetical protein H4R34_006380, partial [Dimargaris verticillata]
MLAFSVIPGIIGQVLESDKPDNYENALKLATQIHEMPDFKDFIKAYPENAPNYF